MSGYGRVILYSSVSQVPDPFSLFCLDKKFGCIREAENYSSILLDSWEWKTVAPKFYQLEVTSIVATIRRYGSYHRVHFPRIPGTTWTPPNSTQSNPTQPNPTPSRPRPRFQPRTASTTTFNLTLSNAPPYPRSPPPPYTP